MPNRRILSLWFPRMGAERLLRAQRGTTDGPLAVVGESGGAQVLVSLSQAAEAAGLRRHQPLRDATAMCPALVTRTHMPRADADFLTALRRWATKFSPWVAEHPPDSLVIDLTGCAHLFGGEPEVMRQVTEDCEDLRLTVLAGIADTVGAAWALARYAGRGAASARSGDAIDQEAHATRSRAAKRRRWERDVADMVPVAPDSRIAQPGQTRQALAALPLAALRLPPDTVAQLGRLGLRRVEELVNQPRAGLARRFGRPLVDRMDQAMGVSPEPVSPSKPPDHFGVRLSLPDPIGLEEDMLAAIDRLLPPLCDKLTRKAKGARQVQLICHRTDGAMEWAEIGLARAAQAPDRIRPLLELKLAEIDAGFGIDVIRLVATVTEPVSLRQHGGHAEATARALRQQRGETAMEDLIGRLGARVGMDAITRRHPGDSHIPEKTCIVLSAAWSEPAHDWPEPEQPRPLMLWRPEPVQAPTRPTPPETFRWRGRDFTTAAVLGPERIAPEWWLDEPEWRSGVRDYWRVTATSGDRLWLFYAHGGAMSAGWFCQGTFP
ncbi:protein ImuB [Tranquillimonas rosea]|uniref:Protein ImuB n=1 Tax=Tranquillimonas rosea TaxID=641238 RepID=A0A1H9U6Z6_9RHOB|nr:DUF6504 family protein [Tranquillimonas rosea]SES05092.1 protein ImuB [Tranquillimonas rosea]